MYICVQFCEVISVYWLKHLSAHVVRIMLDYVDHVTLCSKLKTILVEQKQWPEICKIQRESEIKANFHFILPVNLTSRSQLLLKVIRCWLMGWNVAGFSVIDVRFLLSSENTRSLKHLCRLKIRDCLGRLRLRAPVFISYLPLPTSLKDYIRFKEYDVYSRGSMTE